MQTRLWQITVMAPLHAEAAVAALLEEFFGEPPAIYAAAGSRAAQVSVYCRKRPRPGPQVRARLQAGLNQIQRRGLKIASAKVRVRKVRRENWVESWKRHFKPLEIGDALLVKPSWSRRRSRAGQAVIVIDPGLSFGTGKHPTTAFCLEQVVACRDFRKTQSLLDIGTGSGIVAVAAAKLGYRPIHAFDIDPDAVRAAKANSARNRVGRRLRIFRQDLRRWPMRGAARFDLVCANLDSALLVREVKRIVNRLKPGATLVLAGIVTREFARVRAVYAAAGLEVIGARQGDEWRSGAFVFLRRIRAG